MSNLIGQSFGRYHILEQLGEGGMATVYKAYDTRVETDVAVKVIRTENLPQNAIERSLKRFEREAKALARLTHPNIVKVMDYGEHEGKPYLIMPYFPGGTLKEKMGKPIPWREAFQILLPIAEALDYAHSQKMVHRDVKPSNILLTERGQPMLTDFGIAKILELEETQDLTGTSAALGTPEYMAPEQSTARTVDHRADIYAFGIVLYEMLIGRKPYTADTPLAILIKHAHDPLPSPKMFVPDLPDAVERILFKALAKKPEDRYQSMGEMVKAFEKLKGDGGSRPFPKTISKAGKRKLNILMIILGLAALVLFAVFGLPVLIGKPEPTHMPDALANSEELQRCGNDLCIVKSDGSKESLGIGEEYYFGTGDWYSWSPDATQIVFHGCPLNDSGGQCSNLYLAPRDKSGIKPLLIEKFFDHFAEIWSPDGEWIAFSSSSGIELIHPDGSDRHLIIKTSNDTCPGYMAWSPDSQKLAWIGGGGCGDPPQYDRVWVASVDGSQLKQIFYSTNGYFDYYGKSIAWSPDGQFVAARLQDGTTYKIDAGCSAQPNGCDASSRTEIKEIPKDWLHTFRPQWGERLSPSTGTTKIPTDEVMPTASVTMPPTSAPLRSVINTPLPLEQGSILDECGSGGGLCLTRNGNTTRLTFINASELRSWSWAPDGKQFVVSYCLPENQGKSPCEKLYIVNIETKTIAPLINGPDDYYFAPAWSPDGQTIIYNYKGGLEVMQFDGTTWQYGERIQVPNTCPYQPITWAPDSRQVAWVAGPNCQGTELGKVNRVLITDLNTQITQTIFEAADTNEFLFDGFSSGQRFNLAWSPDGKSVAFKLRNGTVYQIDVSCVQSSAGCDVSSRTKIDSIPANWLNNYHPQWGGVLSLP